MMTFMGKMNTGEVIHSGGVNFCALVLSFINCEKDYYELHRIFMSK